MNQLCFFFAYVFLSFLFKHHIYQSQSQLTASNLEALVMSWLQWASQRSLGSVLLPWKKICCGKKSRWKNIISQYIPISQNKVSRQIMRYLSQVSPFFLGKTGQTKFDILRTEQPKVLHGVRLRSEQSKIKRNCYSFFFEDAFETMLLFPNLTWTLLTDFLNNHFLKGIWFWNNQNVIIP